MRAIKVNPPSESRGRAGDRIRIEGKQFVFGLVVLAEVARGMRRTGIRVRRALEPSDAPGVAV
ncbi:MAG: hypothetical protein JWN29_3065 [Acidimicrobiales bacterium]|nr:hypothetical protein [Acidimicrobiales bacterium]